MSNESTGGPKPLRGFPWRVFWLLFFASVIGAAAALPMAFEVFRPLIANSPPLTIPLPLLIVVGALQNLCLLGLVTGIGLLLARKLGLGAPLLESWLYHDQPRPDAWKSLAQGGLVGIVVGVVLLVPLLIMAPYFPTLPFVTASRVVLWKRFLGGFYGGIDEEVISRLFLLSLFAWIGVKVIQREKKQLSGATFWVANVLVAILFGLGHLPAASRVMTLTPAVVSLALMLNGIAAVSFGYLYRRRGLETAMIAHFCADFVIYVVGPSLLK